MSNDEIAERILNAVGNVSFDDWYIYDTMDYTITTVTGELVANFSGSPKWRGDNLQYVVACSPNNIKSLLNERAALKAENERFREALEPFAKIYPGFLEQKNSNNTIVFQNAHPENRPIIRRTWPCDKETQYARELFIADFRRARKAIKGEPE